MCVLRKPLSNSVLSEAVRVRFSPLPLVLLSRKGKIVDDDGKVNHNY